MRPRPYPWRNATRGADLLPWGITPPHFRGTHFFRKESFRLGCHIQPHRAQHNDDARRLFVGVREAKGGGRKQATGRRQETIAGTPQRLLSLHASRTPILSRFPDHRSAERPSADPAGAEFTKPPVGSTPHSARVVSRLIFMSSRDSSEMESRSAPNAFGSAPLTDADTGREPNRD
jgi:hypothetical protein